MAWRVCLEHFPAFFILWHNYVVESSVLYKSCFSLLQRLSRFSLENIDVEVDSYKFNMPHFEIKMIERYLELILKTFLCVCTCHSMLYKFRITIKIIISLFETMKLLKCLLALTFVAGVSKKKSIGWDKKCFINYLLVLLFDLDDFNIYNATTYLCSFEWDFIEVKIYNI